MDNYKIAAGKLAPLGLIAMLLGTACSSDKKNNAADLESPIASGGGGGSGGTGTNSAATTGATNPQISAANVTVTIGNSTSDTTTGGGDAGGAGGAGPDSNTLPPGFTPAEFGGYKVHETSDEDEIETDDCGSTILGIIRDFRRGDQDDGHADFESGRYLYEVVPGIVDSELGSERKPIFVNAGDSDLVSNQRNFDEWYRNIEGVNDPFLVSFWFEPQSGVLTFASSEFFPLDSFGYGEQELDHNFHFTTEIHTEFAYRGGETFTFQGDDDLWVFINGRLAIDLGGVHPQLTTTIDIDAEAERLGIEVGNDYPLDFFHAERQTIASNFRVETNLEFTNCGEIVDPIIK
jgi:fibro-slime domain-containing protein